MSHCITLDDHKSELTSNFYPPLELHNPSEIALLYFESYNSVPNLHPENSNFSFVVQKGNESVTETIVIPTGAYEISQIEAYLRDGIKKIVKEKKYVVQQYEELQPDTYIKLRTNEATLKTELFSAVDVLFTDKNCIASLLGFQPRNYDPGQWHVSQRVANISQVNIVRVTCNLTANSYINGVKSHTLHEFSPIAPSGYKLSEVPQNLIYLPVNTDTVSNIVCHVKDQNGRLLDFQGEKITLRLHIRPCANHYYY